VAETTTQFVISGGQTRIQFITEPTATIAVAVHGAVRSVLDSRNSMLADYAWLKL